MMLLKHTLQDKVKHTWKSVKYDYRMSTLEDRVLEAIEATKLEVAALATKIGVSRQAVYDWRKGKSLKNMKAENLIELSSLSGYEPSWIITGKGQKKKMLTKEQEQVLSMMQESQENQKMITDIIGAVLRHDSPRRLRDEKRQRELTFNHQDRRQVPWKYNKGGQ